MVRVFAGLALSNILLLVGSAAVGLVRPGGSPDRHILLAVITLIFTCFLQVLLFTYLTVTGKVITQMVHLADLDRGSIREVKRYKKAMTRQLGSVVVGVVLIAGSGGALWRGGTGSAWHVGAGASTILLYLLVVYRQFNLIVLNTQLVDKVGRTYRTWKLLRRREAAAEAAAPACSKAT